MAINKVAAAYLAYFAYIDDALEAVQASDFVNLLSQIPAGVANGPWTLCWGPAANVGVLAYVARGADGTYALAFRGTNVDGSIAGAFENVLDDANFALVPWLYPQQPGAPLQISAGIADGLSLAIALTDPATDVSLLDYLRGLTTSGTLDLMVTGHSLGAGLAVVATAWLHDQLGKLAAALNFNLWPHTFAAPTMWNANFAAMFAQTFPYYAAVNKNDVVPMGWARLGDVLDTFPYPGPWFILTHPVLYAQTYFLSRDQTVESYKEITPSDPDSWTELPASTYSWITEAGAMHSMQFTYFPYVTNAQAPPLPGITNTGLPRTRMVLPA